MLTLIIYSLQRTPAFYATNMGTLNSLFDYGANPKVLDANGWNILMSYIANKLARTDTSIILI